MGIALPKRDIRPALAAILTDPKLTLVYNGRAFKAAEERLGIVISSSQASGSHGILRQAWFKLVSLGFRLLYNEMAWSYDIVSWLVSRGQWREWQRAAIPFVTGRRVLELAHGPGHMLLALQEAGFAVCGLDLSPSMSRLAQGRIRRAGVSVALVRGRAQALPFAQASFDTVLATFPTEFLIEAATINTVFRILRPGGRLVVVPQARLTGGAISRFIEWLYAITGQRPEALAEERMGFWQVIQDRFRAAGFEITLEQVSLEASEVTIAIAQKPPKATTPGNRSR